MRAVTRVVAVIGAALLLIGIASTVQLAYAEPMIARPHVDYKIKSGDTLTSIAKKFDVTLHSVKWRNRIPDANYIETGYVLVVHGDRVDKANRAPAPPVVTYSSSPSYSSGSTASTGGVIPSSVTDCESGGSYTAVNPNNGAYGKYQIMPIHYGSGGLCAGMGKSPGEQDTCASRILDAQGPSAWSCW